MSPNCRKAEAVRLELTSGQVPPPVFETGSSSSRITSVRFNCKVPGVGIEPTASWFRARDRIPAATTPENSKSIGWHYRLRPSSSLIARRAQLLYQQQLPRIALSWLTRLGASKFGEEGSNLHRLVQSQAAYR